jgi:hypothetical protein
MVLNGIFGIFGVFWRFGEFLGGGVNQRVNTLT